MGSKRKSVEGEAGDQEGSQAGGEGEDVPPVPKKARVGARRKVSRPPFPVPSLSTLGEFADPPTTSNQLSLFDTVIALTDQQFTHARQTYAERMEADQDRAEKTKKERADAARGLQMIFGVPAACELKSVMLSFMTWTEKSDVDRP